MSETRSDKLDIKLKKEMQEIGLEATDDQVNAIIKFIAESDSQEDNIDVQYDLIEQLGGLTDDEAQMLADYNRNEVRAAERVIEQAETPEKLANWRAVLNWRRERARIFTGLAAHELREQDRFRRTKGDRDG